MSLLCERWAQRINKRPYLILFKNELYLLEKRPKHLILEIYMDPKSVFYGVLGQFYYFGRYYI